MENEGILQSVLENAKNKIFKADYKDQDLNNNRQFMDWKNKMDYEYGETDKLFYCSEDALYFYASNSQNNTFLVKCPECDKSYCWFCSKYLSGDRHYCCFKRFKLRYNSYKEYSHFILHCVTFFVPYLNLMFINAAIAASLFYKRNLKEKIFLDLSLFYIHYSL